MTLKGKHIILGISGGIAAYKSVTLLRELVKRGAEVQIVITPNGKEFITPVTLSALSGKPVVSEFFSANSGEWHSHVDLGLWADLMVIAPATASTIGKMAMGIADNMLITTYLSVKAPVLISPAMDLDMWAHPSTKRNIETLRKDGVGVIEPQSGFLASGLEGKGRMEEPEKIVRIIEEYFNKSGIVQDLEGKKILISAGPTYENIDPVRFIGNYSSGKMGFALANECAARGAEIILVAGPVDKTLALDPRIERIDVRSAKEMLQAMQQHYTGADITIMAAAVADYAPEKEYKSKIKRDLTSDFAIKLVKNPDISAILGKEKGHKILVGFALETDNEEENAIEKLKKKNLDMIVLNSLRDKGAGMMTDTNKIRIINRKGDVKCYPLKKKSEVAKDIMDAIVSLDR